MKGFGILFGLLLGAALMLGFTLGGSPSPHTTPDIEITPVATTAQGIVAWTATHIRYGSHLNPNPEAVFDSGYGNCLGFSMLDLYFLHQAGIEALLVIGDIYRPDDHAWIMIDNIQIEPQTGRRVNSSYHPDKLYTYEEAMERYVR